MKQKIRFTLLGCLALFTLSACDKTKEQLGLTRQAPDEFAVVKRAPLEMPPNYALRPPRPGASRPQEQATDQQARTVIFGQEQQATSARPDSAESALLQQAGTGVAQPNIRAQVDKETELLEPKDKPVAERILGWTTGDNGEAPATIVDAEAEAERLRQNAREGKPVTAGETPSIEQ